jgi:hypothetical protein
MTIIKRQDKKEVYTVVKRSKKCYALVKVLNIYPDEKTALNGMVDLLQGNIREEELLQEYIKKDS